MPSREWNHTPEDLPLGINPLFQWPLNPKAVFLWYWSAWFPLTINLGIVALAVATYHFAAPTLEQAAAPGLWVLTIWVRNLVIVTILAQGLHLIFHRHHLQGTEHKYDPRPFPRQGRVFTFGDQYWDNVFWALASGVTFWTVWECLIWWSMANEWSGIRCKCNGKECDASHEQYWDQLFETLAAAG